MLHLKKKNNATQIRLLLLINFSLFFIATGFQMLLFFVIKNSQNDTKTILIYLNLNTYLISLFIIIEKRNSTLKIIGLKTTSQTIK